MAGGAPVVSRRNVASHEKVTPTEAVLGLRRVGGGCCLLVRERIRFTPTQYGDSMETVWVEECHFDGRNSIVKQ